MMTRENIIHANTLFPTSASAAPAERERVLVQSAPNSKDIDRWSEMRYQTTLIK